jgi:hypothetical protein
MSTLTLCTLIAVMTGAAVLVPFWVPRMGELPFSPRDVELIAGPRSIRTTLACLVLLLLMVGGTWASFAEGSSFANDAIYFDVLLALLLITSAVPDGRVRNLFARLIGGFMAVSGVLEVASLLADLWRAAADETTPLVTRGWSPTILVSASTDPFGFWYSVAGRAFLVGVLVYLLREYILRRLDKGIGRQTSHASGAANQPEAHGGGRK